MKAMVTSWMSGLLLLLNFALPQSGSAQDTLVWRFSGQSLSMQEQLKILEQAYKEQFKNYPMQMDSLLTHSSKQFQTLLSDTAMMNAIQQQFQVSILRAKELLNDTASWSQQKRLMNNFIRQLATVADADNELPNPAEIDSVMHKQSEFYKTLISKAEGFSRWMTDGMMHSPGHSSSSTLPLQGESTTKELSVKVYEAASVLTLTLKGELASGRIKLEIVDPEGKNQGGYTIEGNGRGREERVSGVSEKQYPSPAIGVWKVKVVSNKAVGTVTLISNQKP